MLIDVPTRDRPREDGGAPRSPLAFTPARAARTSSSSSTTAGITAGGRGCSRPTTWTASRSATSYGCAGSGGRAGVPWRNRLSRNRYPGNVSRPRSRRPGEGVDGHGWRRHGDGGDRGGGAVPRAGAGGAGTDAPGRGGHGDAGVRLRYRRGVVQPDVPARAGPAA